MNDPKHLPIDYEAELAKQAADLQSRLSTPSGDLIRVNQNKTFTFPDGTESSEPFDAVIVDFIYANTYYATSYNAKELTPPECFAIGEKQKLLVPSDNSPHKQAPSCEVCPQNQWGSGNGNGKACRNNVLLALLPPDATSENPLWLLKVSPTAIKHFESYVTKVMRQFNSPPIKVVSKIGFDPQQHYPVVRFGAPRPNENVGAFFERIQEARQRLMTEPDLSSAKPEVAGIAPAAAQKAAGGGTRIRR